MLCYDKNLIRRFKVFTYMFRQPSRFPYTVLKVWCKCHFAFIYRSFLSNCFPIKFQLSTHSVVDTSMFNWWFCNLAFKKKNSIWKRNCCFYGGSEDKLFIILYLAALFVPTFSITVYCTQLQFACRIARFN